MKKFIIIAAIILAVSAFCVSGYFYINPTGSFIQDEKIDTAEGESNPTRGNFPIGIKNGKLYYNYLPS